MNDIYTNLNDFTTSVDLYVESCCNLLDSYVSYLSMDSFVTESSNETSQDLDTIEDEKIEAILDKASKNSSSRLVKSFKKTAKRVSDVENKVKEITNVKVYIADTWSFKKWIDTELDAILKDGNIDNIYGKFFIGEVSKNAKIDNIQSQMHEMTKIMRVPYRISINKEGKISEDGMRKDPIRDTGNKELVALTAGIILNFTLGIPLKGTRYKNLFLTSGIVDAISAKHPIDKAKRRINGTYGNKYETVTIGQLYNRLKELDPDKFGQVSDNEINNIRKFFTRNKKMNRLSSIHTDSSKRAIRLAGKMVNLQAEYTTYRQAIANYYIGIINKAYSLMTKGIQHSEK